MMRNCINFFFAVTYSKALHRAYWPLCMGSAIVHAAFTSCHSLCLPLSFNVFGFPNWRDCVLPWWVIWWCSSALHSFSSIQWQFKELQEDLDFTPHTNYIICYVWCITIFNRFTTIFHIPSVSCLHSKENICVALTVLINLSGIFNDFFRTPETQKLFCYNRNALTWCQAQNGSWFWQKCAI